jgi:Domain of unknown function DUF29
MARYDTDFHAWTLEQVGLLQTQQFEHLDTVSLMEENLRQIKQQHFRIRFRQHV